MSDEHKTITNEDGIGFVKDYTPKYNFVIPYFDIATWHDYLEDNFRSIDALFNYIYEIKQYKGKWTNNTLYNVDDTLFVGDTNSQYEGRLIKVLVEHTTTDVDFDTYYAANPTYYELFDDASAAAVYAQEAKEARNDAVEAATNASTSETNAKSSEDKSLLYKNAAQTSELNAYNYSQTALSSKTSAIVAAKIAQLSAIVVSNVSVDKSNWLDTTSRADLSELFKATYAKYKTIECYSNVSISNEIDISTSNVTGVICFNPNEIITGNYAPISDMSITKGIQPYYKIVFNIYAKELPNDTFTLPRVVCYVKGIVNDDGI